MLSNSQQQSTTFLKIINGSFVVPASKDNPQAVRRTTKTGKEVYELHYDTITGAIEDIAYRKHEHDGITYRSIAIKLSSPQGAFQLDLDVISDAANTFFHVLPNIEEGHPITMNTWLGSDKTGSNRTKFIVKQHGSAIKWAYTNDNPNGRPGWDKTETKDIDGNVTVKWDRTAQVGWFISRLEEQARRFRGHVRPVDAWDDAAGGEVAVEQQDAPLVLNDDLPF
jgi:hypothetical protein